ncbi:hypothetical protein AMECASPLE_034693 [Ameca splendens]|uniref:Uncharacterized protein n=1 Tax=Ameca splendens TaxID=208324 RepID=A0ABV0XKA8_9TELE
MNDLKKKATLQLFYRQLIYPSYVGADLSHKVILLPDDTELTLCPSYSDAPNTAAALLQFELFVSIHDRHMSSIPFITLVVIREAHSHTALLVCFKAVLLPS